MQYIAAPKFIITLIPKVGTRTLLHTFVRKPKHDFGAVLTGAVSHLNTNERYKVVFIRNPFDRMLSCYINKVKFASPTIERFFWKLYGLHGNMTFADFLHHLGTCGVDEHWRPQVDYVNNIKHDHIGILENMEDDLKLIMDKLGLPCSFDVPHLNYSDGIRVTYEDRYLDKRKEKVSEIKADEYYTDEVREIVRKRYAKDFKLYESIAG